MEQVYKSDASEDCVAQVEEEDADGILGPYIIAILSISLLVILGFASVVVVEISRREMVAIEKCCRT